jgi:hypothetical protein
MSFVVILALLSVGIWLVSTTPNRSSENSDPDYENLTNKRKISGGIMITLGLICLFVMLWYFNK